ncbi:hypothetical protein ACWCQK_07180 [Streptomyces sp. NPDC002306]
MLADADADAAEVGLLCAVGPSLPGLLVQPVRTTAAATPATATNLSFPSGVPSEAIAGPVNAVRGKSDVEARRAVRRTAVSTKGPSGGTALLAVRMEEPYVRDMVAAGTPLIF